MHRQEIKAFDIYHSIKNIQYATIIWCCKEAIYKWWGWGKIDFKDMIRIENFELQQHGSIQGLFVKEDVTVALTLYYYQMADFCLVWLASDTL